MGVTLQESLLDLGDEAVPGPLRLERVPLGHGAWVDVQRGWLAGSAPLFTRLAAAVPWRAERRRMYDRTVDVPRLLCFYGEHAPLPDPALDACRAALSGHYAAELGEPFVTAGLCFYRDERDSVAWHGDTIGRGSTQDTMVAIVSLGEARPLLLRPRGGGQGVGDGPGTLRYNLGHGDLIVMGGSCQRTWEHAVPKSARPAGPRISVQFRPHGVRLCSFAVGAFPSLVATDLDGTIIRRDGTISARTVAAFARVEAAGARFVLVTGRPPRVMEPIAAAFGHRGTAICANGALSYDMRTETVEPLHLIPPTALAAAAAALRAAVPGVGIAVEYPDGHAADAAYQAVNWDLNASIPRLADAALFGRPASKLLGRHFGYTCDDLLALALPGLGGLVSVTHSNAKGLVEAAALGVSKATAVAELAARHGIGPQSVIAFGDMPNDLPLLAWAGTSCAVANAHPEVLTAATSVIGSNDEDGVAAYLEKLYP